MQTWLRRLDAYWFAPARLEDLALVRIVVFGFQTILLLIPRLKPLEWISPIRPLSEQLHQVSTGTLLYRPLPLLKLLLLPGGGWGTVHPSAALLTAAFAVAVIAGVLATIGLFARVAMPCAAAANALLIAHWYSYGEFHHGEALTLVALAVLSLAPSAAVWSLDARRAARRGAPPPEPLSGLARWPLRLMQWLIALSYLSAAMAKLHYGGTEWVNGYTMTYYYAMSSMEKAFPAAFYLATLPPRMQVLPSLAALLFEATFVVAVLAPRTAWFYVTAGLCLHMMIYVSMGIAFFQTIVLYSVFVESLRRYPPPALRWLTPTHRAPGVAPG